MMTTASNGEHEPTLDASEQPQRGRIPSDTFANRLVLARRLEGLTIREAAAKCDLHYATWSTWEGGRRPADILDVSSRIAEKLDIDKEWLLFGGPLLPARGRPTKRTTRITFQYSASPVRTTVTQVTGRPDPRDTAQPFRRHRRIDRSQPLAA